MLKMAMHKFVHGKSLKLLEKLWICW